MDSQSTETHYAYMSLFTIWLWRHRALAHLCEHETAVYWQRRSFPWGTHIIYIYECARRQWKHI